MPFPMHDRSPNQQADDPFHYLQQWGQVIMLLLVFGTLVATCQQNRLMKDTIRVDQRAWVGGTIFNNPQIVVDTHVPFYAVIENTGKTPAVRLKGKITGLSVPKGSKFVPLYKSDILIESIESIDSTGVLFPGVKTYYRTSSKKLIQTEVDKISSGEVTPYFFGKVGYSDIFEQRHCTTFCFMLQPDLKTLVVCPTYNEVSDADCEEDQNTQ